MPLPVSTGEQNTFSLMLLTVSYFKIHGKFSLKSVILTTKSLIHGV